MTGHWEVVPLDRLRPDGGWRYDDVAVALKLAASVRRFGQLRPVVAVRDDQSELCVLKGRRLLAALRDAGVPEAVVLVLPDRMDLIARVQLALACEIGFAVDYAKVAAAVHAAMEAGATAAELASLSPFTDERIGYLRTLATFDWSQFADRDAAQHVMDWGAADWEGTDGIEADLQRDIAADLGVEPAGPDSFGGEDVSSEPAPETLALVESILTRQHDLTTECVQAVMAEVKAEVAAAPKRGKAKSKAQTPQLSLFGEEV